MNPNEKIKILEEVYDREDFHITLLGNVYCSLKMDQKINCRFRAKEKDENGFYPCLNLKWYSKENCYEV